MGRGASMGASEWVWCKDAAVWSQILSKSPAHPTKLQGTKKGQAILIAPLQPPALASFRTWGIQRELAVRDLPRAKVPLFFSSHTTFAA